MSEPNESRAVVVLDGIQISGRTLYKLDERGVNIWSANFQPNSGYSEVEADKAAQAVFSRLTASPAPQAEALPSQTSGAEALDTACRRLDAIGTHHRWWGPNLPRFDDFDPISKDEFRSIVAEIAALAKPASEPAGGGVVQNGWRDIGTAPKDRLILVPGRYGVTTTAMWWPAAHLEADHTLRGDWDDGERNEDGGFTPFDPKVWQPLPELPAALSSPASSSPAEAAKRYRFDPEDGGIIPGEGSDPADYLNPAEAEALPAGAERIVEAMEDDPFWQDASLAGTTQQDQRIRHYAQVAARVLSSAPAQEDGSKDFGAHPRGSGQNASGVEKSGAERAAQWAASFGAKCSEHQDALRRAERADDLLAFIEEQARTSRYGVTIEFVVGNEGEAYGFSFGRQRYNGPPLKTVREAIDRARSDLSSGRSLADATNNPVPLTLSDAGSDAEGRDDG